MVLKDYSCVSDDKSLQRKEKDIINEIKAEVSDTPDVTYNLGLYKNDKGDIRTDKYCGAVWLKKNKFEYYEDNDQRVKLIIQSRFSHNEKGEENYASVPRMIEVISEDDEFVKYLCMDNPVGDKLIEFFTDEPLINIAEKDDNNHKLITIISFVKILEELIRRGLMKKIQRNEHNYIGKVRGKIDFNKHINNNIVSGHKERVFCSFNEKTINIYENQILKRALLKAIELSDDLKLPASINSLINVCRLRLESIDDVDIAPEEISKIIHKLPAIYSRYESALRFAYILLSEKTVSSLDYDGEVYVVPYAVNMALLFECYVRAKIKGMIKDSDTELLPFVPDKKNIVDNQDEVGARKVTGSNCYIDGYIVPDIVLRKEIKNEKGEVVDAKYRIFDVKYKDVIEKIDENKEDGNKEDVSQNRIKYIHWSSRRDDRLQLLAYLAIFDSDTYLGHILPWQPKAEYGMGYYENEINIEKKIKYVEIYWAESIIDKEKQSEYSINKFFII